MGPLLPVLALLLGLPATLGQLTRDRPARPPEPAIGGTCLACPSVDFGPFTPTPEWQLHSASLAGTTDCAWYQLVVVAGHRYELATCAPGTATFDTVIEVYDPANCANWVARNDDGPACGRRSLATWDATYTGVVHVKVRPGAGVAGGDFTFAHRTAGVICETCSVPGDLLPLAGSCTCVSGSTTQLCPSNVYEVDLWAGVLYEFTTCPASGCGATASYDTLLRLLSPACASLATNDDACHSPGLATRSTLSWRPTSNGRHRLQVTGVTRSTGRTDSGAYTVCVRQLGCVPAPLALTPAVSMTETLGCSRSVDFRATAQAGASLPLAFAWEITPPPGGFAVPPRGLVTTSDPSRSATFRSRLTGIGPHSVSVRAVNACGESTLVQDHVLVDRVPPPVVPPAGSTVECPADPPPASPRVRDNCDPTPAIALDERTTTGPCPAEWTLRRTWVATDDSGNASAPARQVARVVDDTPPVVTPDTTVAHCVFPADDGRACFTIAEFTPLAADACVGPIAWTFARVTHDEEPLGDCDPPDLWPDVELAGDGLSFCVRAERCIDDPAVSGGRRYLVEAVATDACGNASALTPIATILVPQDSADVSGCRGTTPW